MTKNIEKLSEQKKDEFFFSNRTLSKMIGDKVFILYIINYIYAYTLIKQFFYVICLALKNIIK